MRAPHLVSEYEIIYATDEFGKMNEANRELIAEYYSFLVAKREAVTSKIQGVERSLTHTLYTKERKPEVGNVIMHGNDEFYIVSVDGDDIKHIWKAELEWVK